MLKTGPFPVSPSFVPQVKMTKPGKLIFPTEDTKRRALLDAKYKIFRDAIDIQRRWRDEIQTALA